MADTDVEMRGWVMLEVRGESLRLFGFVDEVQRGNVTFFRLQVPDHDGGLRVARLVNAQTVKAITPCSETLVRENSGRQWRRGPASR